MSLLPLLATLADGRERVELGAMTSACKMMIVEEKED
jgi:hypothetical protein